MLNTFDPDAKCLDGSPGGFFIHQGNQPQNFLVFLNGGGMCGSDTFSKTLESCYDRSKTILGSSRIWPDTLNPGGYLSTDPKVSQFAEWTKIVVGYCDGALFQGHVDKPVMYKGTNLYFRGAHMIRSHFEYLNITYGLYLADNIVFTGISAGAVGNFLWNNYLLSKVSNPNSFWTVMDSGVFLNEKTHKVPAKDQVQTWM